MRSLLLALCALFATAVAQPELSVNGREVPGLTLSLVEGISYAPASAYADALGASLRVDYGAGVATLQLGGRTAVLRSFSSPAEAGPAENLRVNGSAATSPGGVFVEGQLFLPVTALAQAFGGYTSHVPELQRVMVVLPRGRLRDLSMRRQQGADRIIIDVSANVPYSSFHNAPADSLELRFERTEDGGVDALEDGRYFSRAAVLSSRTASEVRISLEPDVDFEIFTVPDGRGYRLVVDLFPAAEEAEADEVAVRVVLDPGHGGDDAGMATDGGRESALTLEFARRLADELQRRGFDVALTRDEDHSVPLTTRSGMGVGSDLFLSLHVHETAENALSVFYLSEADGVASLDLAVRENAEAELQGTTDALRRRLLLNLVPDLEVGRRYAQALQGELFRGGVRASDPRPAPLAVLAGAAGRGVLVELPPEEVEREDLARLFAEVLAVLLENVDGAR